MYSIKSNIKITNRQFIGGKANGLFFLSENGFNVPPYHVLDFNTVDLIIEGKVSTAQLVNQWIKNNTIDADSLWAVRSSANLEDGKNLSFAGLFKTEINVSAANLQDAIKNVIKAYTNFSKFNYDSKENLKFGVIIQEMIKSEYSGVIFSHNPNDILEENIYINIVPGLGENLVSGKEEAFAIKYSKGKISYLNDGNEFRGQIYDRDLKDIVLTADEMKLKLTPYLNKLIKETIKLSKLKKHPVDIEFTIANETVYWLQVRPITSSFNHKSSVTWDNANISENYPGITLPLSISFVKHTYFNAYSGLASFLGMTQSQLKKNTHLFTDMVGGIFGGLYYNITAWQQLLYQLPFGKRTSKQITKIWGMEDAEFGKPSAKSSVFGYIKLFTNIFLSFVFFKRHKRKFEATYKRVFAQYENKDFFSHTNKELLADYYKLDSDLGAKWIVPVLNGFFAFLLFSLLKKIFGKSRLYNEYPNFINDILYSQGDVISVAIVKQFQHLVDTILTDDNLKELFNNEPEDAVLKKITTDYQDLKKQIDNYISNYGERCGEGELKIETINYKEEPIRFISVLKSNAVGSVQRKASRKDFSYKKVIKEKYKYHLLKKFSLLILIKMTLNRIKDRENYRFYRTRGFNIVRKIFRALDLNLYNEKVIDKPGDSLYLELNELSRVEIANNYKNIIVKRKTEYNNNVDKNRANRYIQNNSSFVPAETKVIDNVKGFVQGIGCCSGTITEKVVLVTSDKIDNIDISGKILIANYFEPGWINLFSKAAGIISERGSLLSHTAILCREMGIPAIVGAKGIISAIKDGGRVQMNGTIGEIKIINDDDE